MKVGIFNCHHAVPQQVFHDNIYMSLVSGVRSSPAGDFLGDLDGVNIADKNIYAEIRHQYYVWKNFEGVYDFVGFEHYRRLFFLDAIPTSLLQLRHQELFETRLLFARDNGAAKHDVSVRTINAYRNLRQEQSAAQRQSLTNFIGNYDIVVPRPSDNGGLERQWKTTRERAAIWEELIKALSKDPEIAGYIKFPIISCIFNNMYIMRWSLFDKYMNFLMTTYKELDGKVGDLSRIYGHLGERLLNFFLFQQTVMNPLLRILRQPVLTCNAAHMPLLPNRMTIDN